MCVYCTWFFVLSSCTRMHKCNSQRLKWTRNSIHQFYRSIELYVLFTFVFVPRPEIAFRVDSSGAGCSYLCFWHDRFSIEKKNETPTFTVVPAQPSQVLRPKQSRSSMSMMASAIDSSLISRISFAVMMVYSIFAIAVNCRTGGTFLYHNSQRPHPLLYIR